MIYFVADNHYNARPGFTQYERLRDHFEIRFAEDNWQLLTELEDCSLLILNMISDTCDLLPPDEECEKSVRRYCESGRNLLLLHGSSAAFWHWPWWREIVGMRWVRPNDPDGVPPSVHPVAPYHVAVSKSRHPLTKLLVPMDLPEDEIYTELEYTNPIIPLMETRLSSGTFIQCCQCATPWGGSIINFLPGHKPEAAGHPQLVANLQTLVRHLQT